MKHIPHLVSMTDFILNLQPILPVQTDNYADWTTNYAKLLKTPLTLSMFVPTLPNGKPATDPDVFFIKTGNPSVDNDAFNIQGAEWDTALKNVLFEGFEIKNNQLHLAYGNYPSRLFWVGKLSGTIEDLVRYELKLTPAALKMIYNY